MLFMMLPMMMVEMKRVLRVLMTMMKSRTCLHKESWNVQFKLHEFSVSSKVDRAPARYLGGH